MLHETVSAKGHLIDTHVLERIFDQILEHGASYEILRFEVGTTHADESEIELKITAEDEATLRETIEATLSFGCAVASARDARLVTIERDMCVPEDFYSTTNHRTEVRLDGVWRTVGAQRMDAVIVLEDGEPSCRKLRDVRAGDRVVCGVSGVRVNLDQVDGERATFAFMSNDISSERSVETSVKRVARQMRRTREEGKRIIFVAGPVVIHTDGITPFCSLIEGGWVDAILSGNALAVHDIENSFFGTSLGVSLGTGKPVEEGHKNHMRAINRINHAGSIPEAVRKGVLKSGIMHACVEHDVDVVLAGSIRDDGPLPDTLMDLIEAQEAYAHQLKDAGMVLMLSTMLHSIGVGNMLPSWVRVVCVDINPAVVTKLSDRGSSQTVGVVTDVGLFLGRLAEELKGPDA
jgi:lysine-ketoglutarate reductase/saccharopine dehydrogenase-like protein (TIGR00300 family)